MAGGWLQNFKWWSSEDDDAESGDASAGLAPGEGSGSSVEAPSVDPMRSFFYIGVDGVQRLKPSVMDPWARATDPDPTPEERTAGHLRAAVDESRLAAMQHEVGEAVQSGAGVVGEFMADAWSGAADVVTETVSQHEFCPFGQISCGFGQGQKSGRFL